MACKCLEEFEQKAIEFVKENEIEKNFDVIKYHELNGFKNKVLPFMPPGNWKLTLPLQVGFTYKSKKGKQFNRTIETDVHPSFCPFCGRKYDEEKIELISSVSQFQKAIGFFKENIDFKVPDNLHAEFYTWLNKQGSLFFMSATIERTDGYVKYLNPKTLI